MGIKISFILPTYNTDEKYLKQSIQSVLDQTYKDLELIIIDDGSFDEYSCFIKEYAKIDKRIRLVRNDCNKGLVFSLNRGLLLATGDYCFRMDADDICNKRRAKVTVDYLEKHPDVDILGTQFSYLNHPKGFAHKPKLPESNEEIKVRMIWGSPFAHPTICFRRKSIQQYSITYDSDEKAEDYNLWVKCAIKGCKFVNIHQRLLRYRIHGNQITKVSSNTIKESSSSIRSKLLHFLNIKMTPEEKKLYDSFADGCSLTASELESIGYLLIRVIPEIPESYVTQNTAIKMFSGKYYHECLRSTLHGEKKIPVIYRNSEISRYQRLKGFRILALKCLTFLKSFSSSSVR